MIRINDYQIDASLSETHTFESEATSYPVETGADVTDNVRPKPITVEIEGIVSDTPIGNMVAVRQRASSSASSDIQYLPSDDALSRLLAIRDAREPVTIETSLKLFENMVLTNLEVPRSKETGASLRFTATFQQVILVTNNRATVRVAVPSATPKVDKGTWSAKTGIPGIYVITFKDWQRATVTKVYGPPILSDSYGDHYRINEQDAAQGPADGYIDPKDGKYHPMALTGSSTTQIPTSLNGRGVNYDYAQSSWVDSTGKPVVKVPKGADRWKYVDSPWGKASLP